MSPSSSLRCARAALRVQRALLALGLRAALAVAWATLSLAPGCSSPVPSYLGAGETAPDGAAEPSAQVEFEPTQEAGCVSRAARIEVHVQGKTAPGQAWLFSGALSTAQQRDLAKGSLSNTLAERRVSALAWASAEAGVVIVRPLVLLEAGQTYSLALDTPPFAASFGVCSTDPAPLFERRWPPADDPASAPSFGIWCGASAVPTIALPDALEPYGEPGTWERGVGAEGDFVPCVRWSASLGGARSPVAVVPPVLVSEGQAFAMLEPSLLQGAATASWPPSPTVCRPSEVPFGAGCLEAQAGRLVVRAPDEPLLWALDSGVILDTRDQPRFAVRWAEARASLRAAVVGRTGDVVVWDTVLPVPTLAPRWVLSEVYADPLGSEPAEEWVEILNDGTAAGSLAGYTLGDGSGTTLLPEAWLDRGEFALIVNAKFVPEDGVDPSPRQDATLVRVSEIGRGGLANSGETLTLRDPAGQIVSTFPPWKAKPGVSVQRIAPEGLDDDPAAFRYSSEVSGATPGGPN